MTVEERLDEMNLQLPPPPAPVGAYVPSVRTGQHVFLAGQIPMRDGKPVATGKLGTDLSTADAADALVRHLPHHHR